MREKLRVAAALSAWAIAIGACGKKGSTDLAFGAKCSGDPECASGICLFRDEGSAAGRCTRRCDLGRDDCPEGTACSTIATHRGESVPVCGPPPPIPLGGPPAPAEPSPAPPDSGR